MNTDKKSRTSTIIRKGVIYLSEAVEPFSRGELRALADHAGVKNYDLEITGFLYYDRSRFLQYLEGKEGVLIQLLQKIRLDSRHRIIYTRISPPLENLKFPGWNVQYLPPEVLVKSNLKTMLMDYMSQSQSHFERLYQQENDERIWNMVDRIAQVRSALN